MNCKSAPLMLALTGALTLGIVGCGHSNNNQQQQPAPNGTAQLPPQPPYTTAAPAAGASTMQQATNASAAGVSPGFDDVAGSKGYITQQDAQRIPWLQSHFTQCDANGDGRVTREEYSQCRQGAAQNTMEQPPAQPPQGASSSG